MHKTGIVFLLIACIMASCGNNSSKEEKPAEKVTAMPPVYKMDMLEKIFNNDNWMKVDGKDTSYYYFSRIPSEIKVYKYKIIKGDSAISTISVIRFFNDSLVWEYDDTTHLLLTGVTEKSCEWVKGEGSPGSFFMGFEQKNEKRIKMTVEDNKSFMLTRTLPLSTFLVRSHYDYMHGTNYAFSDTVFSTGKKK